MKYCTKEWYARMQRSAGADWQICEEASQYSESLYRKFYRKELYLALHEEQDSCEKFGLTFDPEERKRDFRNGQIVWRKQLREIFPEKILNQVADLRVLALGYSTSEVFRLGTEYIQQNKAFVEKTWHDCECAERKSWGEHIPVFYDRSNVSCGLFFHDYEVNSFRKSGKNYILTIGSDAHNIYRVLFKHAKICKQENRIYRQRWLYEELYRTEYGYELHVLLWHPRGKLSDLILTFEDAIVTHISESSEEEQQEDFIIRLN